MPLVSTIELLNKAQAGGYAVGAFNCNNMEVVQAIVAAAEAEKTPVIIQASQGAIKYAGLEYIAGLTKIAASRSKVPIAVLHGSSGVPDEAIKEAISPRCEQSEHCHQYP